MTTCNITAVPLNDPQRLSKVNILVVPDFAKDGAQSDNSEDWVNSMMSPDGAQAQILRFTYRIALDGKSIWYQLSENGDDLLRIFRHEAARYQMLQKPLVLIGYGLGGLIIKRALSVLSDPAMSPKPGMQVSSNDVLDIIAGVVFFGTPHTKVKEPEQWCRLTQLLNFAARLPKRFLAHSEADAKAAAIICEDFEQSGLEARVLSIYENRPTKIRSSRWLRKENAILVDKSLAETWAKIEKLLGNDTSHEAVSVFRPGSAIHQEIGHLFISALSMRGHDVTLNAAQDFTDQMELWEDSISQVSMNRERYYSSDDANFGSSLPSNFDVIPSNNMGEYVDHEPESNVWPCYSWEGIQEARNFIGRKDIFEAIDECFFKPTGSDITGSPFNVQRLPCCCINGLGGMGKTQTAIQYAISRRGQFDAIFVIQANNTVKLSETFHKIAPALGLKDEADEGDRPSEEADFVVNRNKALKWLSCPKFTLKALRKRAKDLEDATTRKPNWLLIFDNVENSSILRDYWPFGDIGCILLTTRDARTSNYLQSQSRVTSIYLDKLGTTFASDLLLQLTYMAPSASNTNDASAIVDRLGGLPLAVEQVAAYINGKFMTLREFLSLYNQTLLGRRESDASIISWSHEIVTSWAMDSLGTAASSLIRIYSSMDPDGIKDSILSKPQVEKLPQDYPADELSHIDTRGELLKSSLIRVNMSETPAIVRIHRLVQDIVLARMTALQLIEAFTFVVTVIFEAWPFTENSWDHQAGLWPSQEALLPHIFRLRDIAATYDVSGLELPLKRKFITLLSSGGWYRQERGDFDSGIPLFELGIELCASSSNDFLDLRADLSFGLGGATCDTNRWPEFLVHAQEQLDYRLRSDAAKGIPPSSNTAIAYSELGIAQTLMKQYESGILNCEKAIDIYANQPEVIDSSFSPAFPHIHHALALVGAGRPQGAERGLLGLIEWHEARFGPRHTEFKLGYAWQCCGLIYARTGRESMSIEAYSKAHVHYKATVGPLYHRTGNVCGKIAEYYASLSQLEAADFFFNEAQKAYTSQSHYRPELARHYFIQSQAYQSHGDEEEAKRVLQKSQELYDAIVPDHLRAPLSLDVLNGIVAPWVW